MKNKPKWWSPEHEGAWDRVKDAMKRDWEQTKSDLSMGRAGRDLDQDVHETVKQAAGKDRIPPLSQRTPDGDAKGDWQGVEDDHAYGVGARRQYGQEHGEWNDRLESKLSEEWRDLKSGRSWDEVKSSVRRGWDRAKN